MQAPGQGETGLFPATRITPFEECPSSTAVPHHCGRCLFAVFTTLRRCSVEKSVVLNTVAGGEHPILPWAWFPFKVLRCAGTPVCARPNPRLETSDWGAPVHTLGNRRTGCQGNTPERVRETAWVVRARGHKRDQSLEALDRQVDRESSAGKRPFRGMGSRFPTDWNPFLSSPEYRASPEFLDVDRNRV